MNEIYDENKKYYDYFVILPKIFLIASLILSVIWGIVDTCTFETLYWGYGFINWFLWQLILIPFSFISYVVTKIVISPIILKIELLKTITKNTKK